ncbi:MAG TPA: glycosyltransferase [Gemmatimonadales bacterium]|jgi:glycosyltransferase involved in cell wall biosynthesis
MHIALFFWDRLPVPEYGGTQRMVVALARGLAAAGHRVTLVAGRGSAVPEATLVPVALDAARKPDFDIRPLLPGGVDILLACAPLRIPPEVPWIRRLAGNREPGTRSAPNTLYLSRDHARRHGGSAFVYNGVDPSEYRLGRIKADYDLFLGRLHAAKGHRWAAAGAKRLRRRILIAGGWRPSLSRYVRYVGKVGGQRKADLLAGARAFWMPALWDEPFGITLIEALVSGTPVLGTRRGSLPEIVPAEVGALGDTLDELVSLRTRLDAIEPEACRAHVERHFTHHVMAEGYLRMFRAYLATGVLPAGELL